MARTLFLDGKKWKRARCLEWNEKSSEHQGHEWQGVFCTSEICLHFCLDEFKFGEPEFTFATEKSQKFRKRNPFGVDKHKRGSVMHCSTFHPDFCRHHFATPTDSNFLESTPVQLLHPLFVAVVVPVTFHSEKFDCQVGLKHQVLQDRIIEWNGPVAAWFKCV